MTSPDEVPRESEQKCYDYYFKPSVSILRKAYTLVHLVSPLVPKVFRLIFSIRGVTARIPHPTGCRPALPYTGKLRSSANCSRDNLK